jgi:hypothetical protein
MKKESQESGHEWVMNENVNTYYRFLGVHYFS